MAFKRKLTYRCAKCKAPTTFDRAEEGREDAMLCKECFEVMKRREDPTRGPLKECMSCDEDAVYGRKYLDCKVCREKDWRRNRSGSGWRNNRGPDSFDASPGFENAVRIMEDGRST